jgi:hypothetical protein
MMNDRYPGENAFAAQVDARGLTVTYANRTGANSVARGRTSNSILTYCLTSFRVTDASSGRHITER